jgi:hypothetical protein
VTVLHDEFAYNKINWALISQIYFGNETQHVSDSSSVHHQKLFTVHSAVVEFHFQNKFEKLVHLVGFIIRLLVNIVLAEGRTLG